MTISMYKISVPIFVQFLTAQSACIDKVAAVCEAKQLDPNFFLNMRFYPDMYPYCRQVQQASTHAMRACSALAGTDMPNMPNTETNFAELKARLAIVHPHPPIFEMHCLSLFLVVRHPRSAEGVYRREEPGMTSQNFRFDQAP